MPKVRVFAGVITLLIAVTGCTLFHKKPTSTEGESEAKNNRKVIDVTPPEIDDKENLKIGLKIGDIAPEISLPDPKGKTKTLSSLRGKMVLLDFWAAWCGPCRRENPNLVRAYQKYNKAKLKEASGFEIYSVSLDRNRNAWTTAIEEDELNWDAHVSDLKFWDSDAAKTYKINSIPYNFLLDANGVIVAKNVKGLVLDKTMDEYVEKF